jgi:hypothetical protein
MDDFFIEETAHTPRIEGNAKTGKLRVEGRSLPEDARKFYRPLREWILDLLQSNIQNVRAEFCLEYFNTSTSKVLVDIMLSLDNCPDEVNMAVIWEYEEDDQEMQEVGEDFRAMLGDIVQLQSKSI